MNNFLTGYSIVFIPLLPIVWTITALWLALKRFYGFALGAVTIAALPLCLLFPDALPFWGKYFQSRQLPFALEFSTYGVYLVINLVLLLGVGHFLFVQRSRFKPFRINRWVYGALVLILALGFSFSAGAYVDEGALRRALIGMLLLAALTYPAGILGTICSLALIVPGIATMAEALALFAPVYAIAGWLQWYVVVPKIFSQNSNPLGGGDDPSEHPRSPRSSLTENPT